MKFVADLHIHSHYSRATSKTLNFEHLSKWAQLKGVHVVGTGDIAHPGWLQEMKDKLEPAEAGLFKLKDEYAQTVQSEVPAACRNIVRFMLAGEISSIYKKNDKVRKIHNVIFAPTLEAVERIQAELEKIGNIRSDGRPILGLDSRDLLEIILDIDEQNYLIPAHIWTPWFSLLGSKSGFDSVEECFDDLTPHIFALETGLSSDPPMNWRVSNLDRYTLISNSDAHSPPKLAREANQFDTELSYPAIFETLKSGDPEAFLGTIEFFPEEGKYHYDGHRKCSIRWDPKTTLAHNGICSACGKPVTVGVSHRVETLADRTEDQQPAQTQPFQSLIPLPEILAEVHGVGPNTKRVNQSYEALLANLGSELAILQDIPLEEIEQAGGPLVAEGVRRVRAGDVAIAAGYDGEYGDIKLFSQAERERSSAQMGLFPSPARRSSSSKTPAPGKSSTSTTGHTPKTSSTQSKNRDQPDDDQAAQDDHPPPAGSDQTVDIYAGSEQRSALWVQEELFGFSQTSRNTAPDLLADLNPQQREAALWTETPLVIVAGPGTGKTRTLTYRIAYLIAAKAVAPEKILAITFTNKAAEEMSQRLGALSGQEISRRMTIKTFHAFGAMLLRQEAARIGLSPRFVICSDQDRQAILKRLYPKLNDREINRYLDLISAAKDQLLTSTSVELKAQHPDEPEFIDINSSYETVLEKSQAIDFDDLILRSVRLLETFPLMQKQYQERFHWISVDEYQDINHAQYRLLRLLTGPETNLCVIGDPDQAIYGFRGADRTYFLQFQHEFPGTKTLHLSQNYRSTRQILNASGQVIAKNSADARIEVWSDFVDKTKLEVYQSPTAKAEAEYIVHQIERMIGGTSYFSIDSGRVEDDEAPMSRSFSDFAVLYRLGAQSQLLVEAFQRSGIPYQVVGQTALYEYRDIRHLLAYLWFVHNPDSSLHLVQLLPWNKSQTRSELLEQLDAIATKRNLSLWQALLHDEALARLTAAQKRRLHTLIAFLDELKQARISQPVANLIEQTHRFMLANRSDLLDKNSAERIQRLRRQALSFDHQLKDFLETAVLQKETDSYDPRADRVTMMTLHASKGLEFQVVFIAGCEESLIPYQREDKSFDLEEERRLFYVGMTRAQQKLILSHAKSRFLFGQRFENAPSRFVDDIEQTLKEIKQSSYRRPAKETAESVQLKLF